VPGGNRAENGKIMMAQKDNPKLTITLTGRRPVKIVKDDWPIIASAGDRKHDNQYDFQANRIWEYDLEVRQHEDGRTIVYGIYDYETHFQNEPSITVRGGEIVESSDKIIPAIQRVGQWMAEHLTSAHADEAEIFHHLTDRCIADLPAEEL
jgi:hypothetical protein